MNHIVNSPLYCQFSVFNEPLYLRRGKKGWDTFNDIAATEVDVKTKATFFRLFKIIFMSFAAFCCSCPHLFHKVWWNEVRENFSQACKRPIYFPVNVIHSLCFELLSSVIIGMELFGFFFLFTKKKEVLSRESAMHVGSQCTNIFSKYSVGSLAATEGELACYRAGMWRILQ